MERGGGGGLDGYNTSYIFRGDESIRYGMPSLFPIKEALRLSSQPLIQTEELSAVSAAFQGDSIYPGTPWVWWWEGCGCPGYQVVHQNWTIQCPFVCYSVYEGILYELGSEGVGNPQFTRELYMALQQLKEPTTDKRQGLNLLVWDMSFNFTLKQALESLKDPGVLAKVAQLRTLVTCILIYSELTQAIQELSNAVHKFQKHFNDKTGQVVIQLEATKKHMEAAHIPTHVQATLLNLTCLRQLQGQFYWPYIPSMPENPRRHHNQLE
jgi:hypothetical protein